MMDMAQYKIQYIIIKQFPAVDSDDKRCITYDVGGILA